MDRFLNSHWVVKIAAFLIALMMYTSVSINGQEDNNTGNDAFNESEPYYDTIKLDAKYDDEKYYLMGKPDHVNVAFTGTQADLTNFKLQRKPTAYIDLTGKGPGQYKVKVQIPDLPNNINADFQNEVITVTLHEKKTETFPISVQLINEDKLPNGYVTGAPELETDEITITGAKDIIDEIAYIRGFVNVADAKDTITQDVKLQAYNKDFDPINIQLDPAAIEVTVPIENPSKEIPVTIDKTGSLPKGLELVSAESEEKNITVHAPEDVLDQLESITVPLDLSKITKDDTVEVDVPLPEDAFYSTPGKISIVVDVEQVEETSADEEGSEPTASSRTFNDLPITIKGLSDDEEASFIQPQRGMFDLTVKGNEEDLQSLSKDDILAFVDVESLDEGQYDVEIQVDVPDQFTFEQKMSEATLTISNRSA